MTDKGLTFHRLVKIIGDVHQRLTSEAARAVNVSLTLRNWLIGCYIEEYERSGVDRAKYGDRLMDELAGNLCKQGLVRCDRRELYRYRQFYLVYPQIVEAVTLQLFPNLSGFPIRQALSAISKGEGLSPPIRESVTPQLTLPGQKLLESLSFTHLAELIAIDDPHKRAFYEIECIRGNWSVRELKRQVSTMYFERSGFSKNKRKLAALVAKTAEANRPELTIRGPYVFEFLRLEI